MFMT
jgi:hypothetical protein